MKNIDNARNLLALIDKEIVLDHAKAIIVLFENKIYASAFALARPLFEGFVRASWLLNCAIDDDVNSVIEKDKFKFSFGEMLENIEKKKDWPATLTQAKKNVWNAMHSYTHGGLNQISRRIKSSTIEPVIDEEEIDELICFSSLISFLSFNEMIKMSKASDKNEMLKKFMESIIEWCFNNAIERDKV